MQFDHDADKTADAFGKDRNAMTVFCALLLTVNLSFFSAIVPANFHQENKYNLVVRYTTGDETSLYAHTRSPGPVGC